MPSVTWACCLVSLACHNHFLEVGQIHTCQLGDHQRAGVDSWLTQVCRVEIQLACALRNATTLPRSAGC